MKTHKQSRMAILTIAALAVGWLSTAARAGLFDWAYDGWKAANDAVARYAENTVDNARNAARSTAGAVARGDFDAVASEMVNLYVGWQAMNPFRDTLLDQINAVAPDQVRKYTTSATTLYKKMEEGQSSLRAKTYMNLYQTYKNDGITAYQRMSTGNFDFSEYYRYSFYYAVATADWSNPQAIGASAERIGRDQWAAYSWYSAHTWQGAAIGTMKNEVGLTDESIEKGLRDLVAMLKDNPDMGAVGALAAVEYMKAAKLAQCKVNSEYCTQSGQRICGKPSEQHTISLHNKTNAPLLAKVHVRADQSHCENHVCDMNGVLPVGGNKSCVVFGQWDTNKVQVYVQAWGPGGSSPTFTPLANQDQFPPITPEDGGYPALQWNFNKSAGNSIDLSYRNNSLCMDAGNQHVCGNFQYKPNLDQWVSQPPQDTIRDARGQLMCAPKDMPGVGRAFRSGGGIGAVMGGGPVGWSCQFGSGGSERTYTSNFVFLRVNPNNVLWKTPSQGGAGNIGDAVVRSQFSEVMSYTQYTPVCRANPGGGWQHMEFGWVYENKCVLGWGGRSPSFPQYETLFERK